MVEIHTYHGKDGYRTYIRIGDDMRVIDGGFPGGTENIRTGEPVNHYMRGT